MTSPSTVNAGDIEDQTDPIQSQSQTDPVQNVSQSQSEIEVEGEAHQQQTIEGETRQQQTTEGETRQDGNGQEEPVRFFSVFRTTTVNFVRRVCRSILESSPVPAICESSTVALVAGFTFPSTNDGKEVANRLRNLFRTSHHPHDVFPSLVGLILVGFFFLVVVIGYLIQRKINSLEAKNAKAKSLKLKLWTRGAVSLIFPTVVGFVGGYIIKHADSYRPIFFLTWGFFHIMVALRLEESFSVIDAVASLNVALAVKMPNQKVVWKLCICLIPGCLKSILPPIVDLIRKWAYLGELQQQKREQQQEQFILQLEEMMEQYKHDAHFLGKVRRVINQRQVRSAGAEQRVSTI